MWGVGVWGCVGVNLLECGDGCVGGNPVCKYYCTIILHGCAGKAVLVQ